MRIQTLSTAVVFLSCITASVALAQQQQQQQQQQQPAVTPVPERVFEKYPERDREAARAFYGKHVDVGGLSILAHASVADEALVRTHEIVGHMLAARPDVLAC